MVRFKDKVMRPRVRTRYWDIVGLNNKIPSFVDSVVFINASK